MMEGQPNERPWITFAASIIVLAIGIVLALMLLPGGGQGEGTPVSTAAAA
jgi:hypothetical protein